MRPITEARAKGSMIGELSRRTGVHMEMIRFYEKIKMRPAPPCTPGGRRHYGPVETRALAFIRWARELVLTLDDVRTLLALGGPEKALCDKIRDIAAIHLNDIRVKMADLKKLECLLSKTVAQSAAPARGCCKAHRISSVTRRYEEG